MARQLETEEDSAGIEKHGLGEEFPAWQPTSQILGKQKVGLSFNLILGLGKDLLAACQSKLKPQK